MYELKINQKVPYTFSDGRESTTTETLTLFFNNMENITQTINLMMLGSKCEIDFELREIEEGQVADDED